MNSPNTSSLLNRLLGITCRSFPQYLQYARPYVPGGRQEVLETFDAIVADQNRLAQRISQLVIDAQQLPRPGEFPMEFTDSHDLDIDFLVSAAISYQRQDIESIGALAEQLQNSPAAKSLTEEALGMAKGHLDSLTELLDATADATAAK